MRIETNNSPKDSRTDELLLSTAYNNLVGAYMQCEDYESANPLWEESLKFKLK
jgi:hypothetical protein